MVKLKGPGMAQKAAGGLGQTLIFSESKGRAYVKRWAKPANPRSAGQLAMRAITAYLSTIWRHLPALEQSTWDYLPMQAELSRFHACLSYNLARWRNFETPCTWYPPAGVLPMQTFNTNDVTLKGRGINHRIISATQNVGRAFFIHRGTSSGFTPTWENLIHIIPILPFDGTWNWMEYPKPGTYWHKTSKASADANQSTYWPTGPIVVA